MPEQSEAAQQQADTLSDSSDRHLDDWMATVLSVIDKLRDRKARPDVERIFVMANRQRQQNPGGAELTRDAVASILQRLVEQRQVMRVEYKGSVSYRNASSWHRRKELASGRNSPDTTQRVLAAAKSLPDGATFTVQMLHARMLLLQQHAEVPPMSATALSEALEREAAAGRLFRLGPSRFQLDLDGSRRQAALRRRKERVQLAKRRRAAAAAAVAAVAAAVVDDADNDNGDDGDGDEFVGPPAVKRAAGAGSTPLDLRLCGAPRRRRRRKKSPVVASRAPSASSSSMDAAASASGGGGGGGSANSPDLCDFCQSPPSANRMGVPERMLRCRDCAHKAHPSCMLYGPELAARACQSPWQCSECKTCCVCSGSGDPELILICDACDKGYHVSCHRPRVTERPASDAKWVCSRCREEERADGSGQQPPPQESQAQLAGDASLWSIAQVRSWLDGEGFPLAAQACVEQEIDGASLMLMKRMDVLTGLGLKLGPAVKVFDKISRLQGRCRTLLQVKQCVSEST
ncbi:hypothetical protein BOX15_Mlig008857g1 [Macrostomum lignano]|uniref:Histone acetyltransferase n=1 Tax=Macrostomum lignano TaxID=282301 RepID=A0A267DSX6_9PLAT|nr:hypothetical protein BOX15_Mlig008857g1 [Macrostomum lignano]